MRAGFPSKKPRIKREAECDLNTAQKYYSRHQYDVEKAISAVCEILPTLTIGNLPLGLRSVGFSIFAIDEHDKEYSSKKRNDVFIPTDDFTHVLSLFESAYGKPLNHCVDNIFSNAKIRLVIEQLRRRNYQDEEVAIFMTKIADYLEDKVTFAHRIVVEGNL